MTRAIIAMTRRGLPQVRGRLLLVYRLVWALLAASALAVLANLVVDGSMEPFVLGIRLAKSAILIAVASVLFWKRPRDPVAAILALAFLCWTITSSVDFTSAEVWPMLLDRLRFLLFALALLLFPDGKWRPRWTRQIAAASVAVFALGVVEALGFVPTALFLPLAIACVLAAILSLILRFGRTSNETQQQQLKWVAFGLVSGVSLILAARACAALSRPALPFEAMFQLGIVLVALGFLVPLLRYRLYDAEAVISRSVGYAILTAALIATFAGSEALIEMLGQQYLGSGIGQISGAMAAALAAVLLAPLNDRINNWVEVRFRRDLVQLRTCVPELLSEIPPGWSPRQIANAVIPPIAEAINATYAAVVVNDEVIAAVGIGRRELTKASVRAALQLPLRSHFGELKGTLLVGPRPDGSTYGKDEAEVVEAILPALSRELLVSIERQRAELSRRRLRSELNRMSTRLRMLESSIKATDARLRAVP
jgi:hypothetical protein